MAFDPDAYLNAPKQFNPDAYLSNFNPDEYLSKEKRKTGKLEDMGIGLTNMGHAVWDSADLIGGGIKTLIGDTEEADRLYKLMEDRQAADKAEASTREQGVGGEIISGLTGLIPMVAAMPVTGPLAAIYGLAGTQALSQSSKNIQAGATVPQAMTQAAGEIALDRATMGLPIGRGFVKGGALGAGGNLISQGGADLLGHVTMPKEAQEPYEPSLRKYGVTAAVGGGVGSVLGRVNRTGALEAKPKSDDVPVDEQQLMAETHNSITRELEKAQSILDDTTRVIDYLGKENTPDSLLAEHAQAEVNTTKLLSDMADLEARMAGDTARADAADKAFALDIRVKEIKERLKAEKAAREEGRAAEEPPPIGELRPLEEARPLEEVKPEEITLDDSTLPKEIPEEIIARDVVEPKEAVVEPITNREAPTSPQIANLVREHKTVGDVLATLTKEKLGTKAEQALIIILSRIPHVRNAVFQLGTAVLNEKGQASTGAYIKEGNVVELHNGGNLKTILHEAVHAATVHLLDQATSVPAKALISMFNKFQADPANKGQYGFTNVKEFVSEAYTNKDFQAILSDMKTGEYTSTGKARDYWSKFKDIVKDALSKDTAVRTALDDVLDAGADVMHESQGKSETWFKKMSEGQSAKIPEMVDLNPLPLITRNYFGMNVLAKLYGHIPQVKSAYTHIRSAVEEAKKLENSWLNDTNKVLAGKMSFMDTMRNVADKASAKIAIIKTSDADMSVLHDLFHMGFTNRLDYATNLARNGQHLSPELTKTYNKLAELFKRMYDDTEALQSDLGKTHGKKYRDGWYPAKRDGVWSVEIGFNGTLGRVQTFPTKHAADMFREQIGNTKHVTVSEAIDTRDGAPAQVNRPMAEIVGDKLAKDYPNLAKHVQESIDNLMREMEAKGGKLGQHHKYRTNVAGYRGTELFADAEKQGHSFKRGILGEVENFGANARGLMIKHNLDPIINDAQFKQDNPRGHAVVQTMYEKSMGRIDNAASKFDDGLFNITDKLTNTVMQEAFKTAFKGEEGSALGAVGNTLMPVFYASKVFAKATFGIAQVLTTSFVIPELAKGHNTPRAFYSFGKGLVNLVSHNKELMESIQRTSQEFGTFSPQVRESLNIERDSQLDHSLAKKTGKFILDYPLLMKLGELGDSGSRVVAYAAAFTHFRDLGMPKAAAEAKAREVAGTTMTEYGTMGPGAVYDRMGAMGHGAKPLTTFATNQLGNFLHYAQLFSKGDTGPILSYVAIAMMTGGALSLPLIADYEVLRQLAMKFGNITMPSVMELLRTDNTFLDRLTNNPNFTIDSLLMGPLSGATGMDLTPSMRGNPTPLLIAAQIATGIEDFEKMYPIAASSLGMAAAIPKVMQSALGEAGVVDPTGVREGGKAIDSLVSGHVNYALKEALNKRQSKVAGEPTGMIARGSAGDAGIEDSPKARLASALGGRTTEQTYSDRFAYEQLLKDQNKQSQIKSASSMFTETLNPKYLNKMIDLGMTDKEIENKIGTEVYNKVVAGEIRAIRNKGGTINKNAARDRIPFMRNRE
jgi:uncharacterized membrane-anchored protein YhcB (DUF1043 family)/5-hydroxyisourate hydrolase-like protein (transthyretin family)